MIRALPLTILLSVPGVVQARELTAHDLQIVEHVNQSVNARHISWSPSDRFEGHSVNGPCVGYALAKAAELDRAGIPYRLAVVVDEQRELHAVVDVDAIRKGKPVTIVLDQRFSWTQTRSDLETYGYQWVSDGASAEALPNHSNSQAQGGTKP